MRVQRVLRRWLERVTERVEIEVLVELLATLARGGVLEIGDRVSASVGECGSDDGERAVERDSSPRVGREWICSEDPRRAHRTLCSIAPPSRASAAP